MIAAIVIASVALFALFVFAAVAGNRAQTRMVEAERAKNAQRNRDARTRTGEVS